VQRTTVGSWHRVPPRPNLIDECVPTLNVGSVAEWGAGNRQEGEAVRIRKIVSPSTGTETELLEMASPVVPSGPQVPNIGIIAGGLGGDSGACVGFELGYSDSPDPLSPPRRMFGRCTIALNREGNVLQVLTAANHYWTGSWERSVPAKDDPAQRRDHKEQGLLLETHGKHNCRSARVRK